ncbi:hypothetical protein TIFTF001_054734 [Ficus carica]|uniref:Uncharacterized protein n=1 Tax=Ficus carica TaxID=3494 RepID=A0AA88ED02_FICCA|nr:hypothetical protein TIFTF001_054731 [Ficus carica]GMN72470.1 hypothetical protein TIFTF001_054732 [Ficus carica]GMN72472.1 hypothetical protein TIFTF001_054733 [Ficus carica]GMN72477.1 hypothetical protein TIFTF001_054734 [Ficus carica]
MADCCRLLLSAGVASRSIATLSVNGCSIRWCRLQWAVTMGDGGSSGLGKLGSRFSFVIDIRLLSSISSIMGAATVT